MVNEAALLAGRLNKVVVEKIDFIQAVERSIAVFLSLSRHPYALIFFKFFHGFSTLILSKIYYLGRDNKFTANTTIDSIVNISSSFV